MKTENCLMFYRYSKNPDGTLTPVKVFVSPASALIALLDKLNIKLGNLMGYPEPDEVANMKIAKNPADRPTATNR